MLEEAISLNRAIVCDVPKVQESLVLLSCTFVVYYLTRPPRRLSPRPPKAKRCTFSKGTSLLSVERPCPVSATFAKMPRTAFLPSSISD